MSLTGDLPFTRGSVGKYGQHVGSTTITKGKYENIPTTAVPGRKSVVRMESQSVREVRVLIKKQVLYPQ